MSKASEEVSEEDSDEALIDRVCRKDVGAFEELLRRYSRTVLPYVVSIVRDHALAEDVAQETFVNVFRNACQFKLTDGSCFRPWFYRIARNAAISALRERNRRRESGEAVSEEVETHDSISGLIDLRKCLEKLREEKPEFAEVLQLRMEGYSSPEIAKMLGIHVDTIDTRTHRARKYMELCLQGKNRQSD